MFKRLSGDWDPANFLSDDSLPSPVCPSLAERGGSLASFLSQAGAGGRLWARAGPELSVLSCDSRGELQTNTRLHLAP